MSKFNARTNRPIVTVPAPALVARPSYIASESVPSGQTYNGAPGFARTPQSELFLLAVSNMVGENTFYEKASDRDTRFNALVAQVTLEDPAWMARFLPWLRQNANMRSASLVAALEAARALVSAGQPGGRQLVNAVLQRADEPGEALAYWTSQYGKRIPKPIKRGIADAATRLYTEYSLLKYDSTASGYRFADVLDLTHPDPSTSQQGDLFKYALARRHKRDEDQVWIGQHLPMVAADRDIRAQVQQGVFDALSHPRLLEQAGMTWQDALSLAGANVDKRKLWEALIPSMGFLALLRNLRNFDQAGISAESVAFVSDILTNPYRVSKSQLFPSHFLVAYRALSSLRWAQPLETALDLSLRNMPELTGRTLVLVDRSVSMFNLVSAKSELTRADQGAIFGTALALRNPATTTLVEYGTGSRQIHVQSGDSTLRTVNEKFHSLGGTNTYDAIGEWFNGHDRIVVITDEQANVHPSQGGMTKHIPNNIPFYTWNLAGYRHGHTPNSHLVHTFGGFNDAAFGAIPLIERGSQQDWPF